MLNKVTRNHAKSAMPHSTRARKRSYPRNSPTKMLKQPNIKCHHETNVSQFTYAGSQFFMVYSSVYNKQLTIFD